MGRVKLDFFKNEHVSFSISTGVIKAKSITGLLGEFAILSKIKTIFLKLHASFASYVIFSLHFIYCKLHKSNSVTIFQGVTAFAISSRQKLVYIHLSSLFKITAGTFSFS